MIAPPESNSSTNSERWRVLQAGLSSADLVLRLNLGAHQPAEARHTSLHVSLLHQLQSIFPQARPHDLQLV